MSLSIAAIPFFARVAEIGMHEVDHGLIEAAQTMGCSNWQIVYKLIIPEVFPSLVLGTALTIFSLFIYSAMAGAIDGGGLGDLAIRYAYQRFETEIMIATEALLILLVHAIQFLGNKLALKLSGR